MAKPAMVEMAFKKKAPRFEQGEPEGDGMRGGAPGEEPDEVEAEADEGEGEETPRSEERLGGDYSEHGEMALDDLADIAGVAPEDRQDFGHALNAFVHSCVAKALAERDGEPEEEEEAEQPEEG